MKKFPEMTYAESNEFIKTLNLEDRIAFITEFRPSDWKELADQKSASMRAAGWETIYVDYE